jgi:hypothetical protein
MFITVDNHTFREAFNRMGRGGQFSYEGLNLLFDYLEECEDERNESELDVVAICCDYSEETVKDISEMYNVETNDGYTQEEAVVEFLEEAGAYVGTTSTGTIVFFNQ